MGKPSHPSPEDFHVSFIKDSNLPRLYSRISSYGRKKRELSSYAEETSRNRGDVLVTQAFLVTDKFGKKSTSEPKPTKPKAAEPVIKELSPPSPPPSTQWLPPAADDVTKDLTRLEFNFDQVKNVLVKCYLYSFGIPILL